MAQEENARFSGGPIVPLKHWSDVVFLEWQNLPPPETPSPIKYVVKHQIQDLATKDMLFEACRRHGPPYVTGGTTVIPSYETRWTVSADGRDESGANAFWAILGTPHGIGVAQLLAQHKKWFGVQKVDSIDIFSEQNQDRRGQYSSCRPTLVFKLSVPTSEGGG